MYTSALRNILNDMADNIKVLVDEETETINYRSKWPIVMLVCLIISVPVIVYLSSKASYSMRQSSRIFDEQAEDLNYEKRKTDGLLQQLELPPPAGAAARAAAARAVLGNNMVTARCASNCQNETSCLEFMDLPFKQNKC